MSEVMSYTDPLLDLLKDPNLNKHKDKAHELVEYIEEIEDSKLKSWCIESFEILRDLEKIEVQINNWEFQTLDFNLSVDQIMLDEQDVKKRRFQRDLAQRVSKHCLQLHKVLVELGIEIDELSGFSRKLSVVQKISDPGTILTELGLRVIRLQSSLVEQLSIHYSRARLVNIGMSLEDLVGADEDGQNGGLTNETVSNYKQFVNNLLSQLNECVRSSDTIGAMECISIVNDVEKMFQSMKAQRQQEKQRRIMYQQQVEREAEQRENERIANERRKEEQYRAARRYREAQYQQTSEEDTASQTSSTLYGDEEKTSPSTSQTLPGTPTKKDAPSADKVEQRRKRRDQKDVSMNLEDSTLHKTTLSAKMPQLLSAFEEAKAAESGLMEAIDSTSPQKRGLSEPDSSSPSKRAAGSSHSNYSQSSDDEFEDATEPDDDNDDEDEDSDDVSEAESQVEIDLPKPSLLPQPSILRSFFQPTIRQPIYIAPTSPPKRRYQRQLDGDTVKKKLLQYEQEENTKDLDLPTHQLSSIEIGSGRVKKTVNVIEEQLPSKVQPPSPQRNANNTTRPTGGLFNMTSFVGPAVPPGFAGKNSGPASPSQAAPIDIDDIDDSID